MVLKQKFIDIMHDTKFYIVSRILVLANMHIFGGATFTLYLILGKLFNEESIAMRLH